MTPKQERRAKLGQASRKLGDIGAALRYDDFSGAAAGIRDLEVIISRLAEIKRRIDA